MERQQEARAGMPWNKALAIGQSFPWSNSDIGLPVQVFGTAPEQLRLTATARALAAQRSQDGVCGKATIHPLTRSYRFDRPLVEALRKGQSSGPGFRLRRLNHENDYFAIWTILGSDRCTTLVHQLFDHRVEIPL
jgi:hypothetical protein